MRSNAEMAELIVGHLGGAENITGLYHCATRLRFTLKDKSKFDLDFLKAQPEILGAVQSGEESQVIIGGKVGEYFQAINKEYHLDENSDGQAAATEKNPFKRLINTLVGIMAPIITPLIGGGMFKVVVSLLTATGVVDKMSQNYAVLNFMSDSIFYFLPFMLAVSAAKKFKTNEFLAMALAGVLLHPTWAQLVAAKQPVSLFGAPISLVSYGGSVIPIILIVWIMSYVEKFAEKVSPNVIKTMLKPLLILLIMAPLALIVIGPIGSWLGDILYMIINFSNKNVPWLVPTLMGAFTPLLVMVGMYVSLVPLATLGITGPAKSENILGPGMLASNISQAGAAFAIAVKDKNLRAREVAVSAGITALSGITEPALYGVTLKYKRTLFCVMAAGGLAGLYAGITGLVRYSFGSPGIFTLPAFIGSNPNNFTNALITAGLAFVLSFVFTFVFTQVEKPVVLDTGFEEANVELNNAEDVDQLHAPVDGKNIPLAKVNDEVFASGALGTGVGIIPETNLIVSPIDGKVTMTYPTGHAVGLTSDKGNEYLIHIGINTVNMNGDGFKVLVSQDQTVKKGDPLVEVDFEKVKAQGFDPTVILVALNKINDKAKVSSKEHVSIDDAIIEVLNQ